MITTASDYEFADFDDETVTFEPMRRGRKVIMPNRTGGTRNRHRGRARSRPSPNIAKYGSISRRRLKKIL